MASLKALKIRNFNGAKVIGKSVVHTIEPGTPNPVPDLWQRCFQENAFEILVHAGPTTPCHVGWMGEFDKSTGRFTYIAGMLLPEETPVPSGYESRTLPPCRMGIGWIKGREPDIYLNAHTLTEAAIKESVYLPDHSFGYSMEVYHPKRFAEAMEKGRKDVILDYWQPVKHPISSYYPDGKKSYRIVKSLYESLLCNEVPEGKIGRIMEGCGDITDRTARAKRAAWVAEAMNRLDEELPEEERKRIREFSACCLGGKREKLSKAIAAEGGSLKKRIAKANDTSFVFGHSVKLLNDGKIQVQFFPDGRESYSCVCLKGAAEPMSTTYCMCCGGHIKHHLQTVTEKELDCEILYTPLSTGGKKPCTMEFTVVG